MSEKTNNSAPATPPAAEAPGVNSNPTPPPRRGRGRPPGSTNKAAPLSETPLSGAQAAPRRGRPRKVHVEIDPGALARQVKSLHGTAAFLTGLHELRIDDDEAKALAESFAAFAREFDFQPNPKIMAVISLAAAMAEVYTPRVIAIGVRAAKAKRAKQNGQTFEGTATEVSDGQPGHTPAH